jgi:hypothetical protein
MDTQERQTKRKPLEHTRKDNPAKTVARTVFSGLSALVCPYGFLWIVHPSVPLRFAGLSFLVCHYGFVWVGLSCVPIRFSLRCPFLCALTVFSGLSALVRPYVFSRVQTTQRKPKGHTRKDN